MFERFVSGRRPSWKRRAVLISSLALHATVGLGLVVASVFHVAEITPPLLAVVFNPGGQPPPPPPPPAAHKRATPTHRVTTPTPRTQPLVAPPTQPEPDPDPAVGEDTGVAGGKGPKGGTGPLDGDPTSKATGPCVGASCIAAPAPRPRNVAPHALDAARVAGAMPHLPATVIASRRGLGDSTFTAKICVDQSGTVSSVSVLSGIPGADADILATLRGWRYKPQPIPVCFLSQFVFDVQER